MLMLGDMSPYGVLQGGATQLHALPMSSVLPASPHGPLQEHGENGGLPYFSYT